MGARRVVPCCTRLVFPILLAVGPLQSGALAAQRPSAVRLGAPTLTAPEPFSDIAAVAELSDGRLLVADRKERIYSLLARDGRSIAVLGRNGAGPNEYASASGIVRLAADTLGLYGGNQRYLRLTPQGAFAGAIPIPTVFLRAGGLAPPRGADARGAIYWDADVVGRTASGNSNAINR